MAASPKSFFRQTNWICTYSAQWTSGSCDRPRWPHCILWPVMHALFCPRVAIALTNLPTMSRTLWWHQCWALGASRNLGATAHNEWWCPQQRPVNHSSCCGLAAKLATFAFPHRPHGFVPFGSNATHWLRKTAQPPLCETACRKCRAIGWRCPRLGWTNRHHCWAVVTKWHCVAANRCQHCSTPQCARHNCLHPKSIVLGSTHNPSRSCCLCPKAALAQVRQYWLKTPTVLKCIARPTSLPRPPHQSPATLAA